MRARHALVSSAALALVAVGLAWIDRGPTPLSVAGRRAPPVAARVRRRGRGSAPSPAPSRARHRGRAACGASRLLTGTRAQVSLSVSAADAGTSGDEVYLEITPGTGIQSFD